jgi:Phosphotransferase enzyme family
MAAIATPPPAEGMRLDWFAIPEPVRHAVEEQVGSTVAAAISQPTGFSPGVAARLRLTDGRRLFAKAAGPVPNPGTPEIHRREARIMAALPLNASIPRLLGSYDGGEGGWVVLLFEEVAGAHPAQPWQLAELDRVLHALDELGAALTPSPLLPPLVETASEEFATRLCGWQLLCTEEPPRLARLDPWSQRHLAALAELEALAPAAVAGETLLHFDIRADNLLLTEERVWFVDWPLACVGAAWVDLAFFAPSVAMQGGPPPEELRMRSATGRAADPNALTAGVVAMAGFFTHRSLQPPPPGLPTLRAFQAAQGVVARQWVAQRTGWS